MLFHPEAQMIPGTKAILLFSKIVFDAATVGKQPQGPVRLPVEKRIVNHGSGRTIRGTQIAAGTVKGDSRYAVSLPKLQSPGNDGSKP